MTSNTQEELKKELLEHGIVRLGCSQESECDPTEAIAEFIDNLINLEVNKVLDRLEQSSTSLCDNPSSDMAPTFVKAVPLSAIEKERRV